MRREVEEKGLKLSNREGGKERQSKVVGSCCCQEERFQECSKKRSGSCNQGGITRSGLENENDAGGSDVRCEVFGARRNRTLQKNYVRIGVGKLLRMGLVFARRWREQAVDISATESLQVEAAAAGRKESVSQSLFVEVDEEDVSTLAALFRKEGVWTGRWRGGGSKAWRKQILEVQTWRRVRGLAGAVTCETGDLGIKCAQRHTLLFEGQVAVDMRVVLPAGRGEDVV